MNAVGSLLSEYRKRNHLSQLDLGLRAEVSPRHISFIETGKSQPSREMLLKLADTLGLSLHESNLLLHSCGFAAPYSHLPLDDERMSAIREALALMLEKQNPFPALVMDGDWNIIMVNKAQQLLSDYIPMPPSENHSSNILELVFDTGSFRPFIHNWDEVASHLLRRLRRQMIAYSRPGHVSLFKKLLTMDPPTDWQQPDLSDPETPMLTIDLQAGDQLIKMFSTLSQFGTALDVGTEELLIENYFPANREANEFFVALHGNS